MTDLLLSRKGRFRKLVIKKDQKHNIVMVEGATMVQEDFTDAKELERVYYQGLDNRKMRSTFVNETSSRSHLLFVKSSLLLQILLINCSNRQKRTKHHRQDHIHWPSRFWESKRDWSRSLKIHGRHANQWEPHQSKPTYQTSCLQSPSNLRLTPAHRADAGLSGRQFKDIDDCLHLTFHLLFLNKSLILRLNKSFDSPPQ